MTRKTILLVDDSQTAITFEQMVLGNGPYDFLIARDGREAVDKAMAMQPDLILLDVVMPEMDGFEVCRVLRKDERMREIPIIMVTTKGEMEDMETGFSGGCNDYITKPVDGQELLEKVQSWLGVSSDGSDTQMTSLDVANARLDAATNRDEVVEAITEIIVNLIGSEEFAIFTLDEKAPGLRLLESQGIASWRYRNIPVDDGVIGRVAATGEPYIISDGDYEPDPPDLTACFPLKLGHAVTGAIAIFRLLPQKPGLEATDCELLDSLGIQAGAALYRTATGSEAR